MTWTPISGTLPIYLNDNGEPADKYYLKLYRGGTTTPLSMATDNTGTTTMAKAKVVNGQPLNGSGNPFIPHVNQSYKMALYLTSADADADNTGAAVFIIDNIPQSASVNDVTGVNIEVQQGSSAAGQVFTLTEFTYTPGMNNLSVFRNGQRLNLGASYDYTETSSSSITLDSGISIADNENWTFIKNDNTSTSSTLASLVTFTTPEATTTTVQDFLSSTSQNLHAIKSEGAANPSTWDYSKHALIQNTKGDTNHGLGFGVNTSGNYSFITSLHPGTSWKQLDIWGDFFKFFCAGNEYFRVTSTGSHFYNAVSAPSAVTNGVVLYAEDVTASSELKVVDEAGNRTTLSPHNFSLTGGPSEEMAWAYYSEKNGKKINVDMLKAIRVLEKLSGETLVYEG